jgi:hypothetical protein
MNLNRCLFCLLALMTLLYIAQPVIGQDGFRRVQACPTPRGISVLSEATTIQGYDAAILHFLSNDGQPADLEKILLERKLVQPHVSKGDGPINPWFLNHGGARTADFNGDGYLVWCSNGVKGCSIRKISRSAVLRLHQLPNL